MKKLKALAVIVALFFGSSTVGRSDPSTAMDPYCALNNYGDYLVDTYICRTVEGADWALCWLSGIRSALSGDFSPRTKNECLAEAGASYADCMTDAAIDFATNCFNNCLVTY